MQLPWEEPSDNKKFSLLLSHRRLDCIEKRILCLVRSWSVIESLQIARSLYGVSRQVIQEIKREEGTWQKQEEYRDGKCYTTLLINLLLTTILCVSTLTQVLRISMAKKNSTVSRTRAPQPRSRLLRQEKKSDSSNNLEIPFIVVLAISAWGGTEIKKAGCCLAGTPFSIRSGRNGYVSSRVAWA